MPIRVIFNKFSNKPYLAPQKEEERKKHAQPDKSSHEDSYPVAPINIVVVSIWCFVNTPSIQRVKDAISDPVYENYSEADPLVPLVFVLVFLESLFCCVSNPSKR